MIIKNFFGFGKDGTHTSTLLDNHANYITYKDEQYTVSEFSKKIGVSGTTVYKRMSRGWTGQEMYDYYKK